jgi:hypothetical protein
MHQIVKLVSRKAPEVQELEAFCYVVSRDKAFPKRDRGHMVDSCEKRLSITLKRPVCLTKDDMELRVTMLVHRFKTGAHILSDFHRNMPLQLLNSKVISLPMSCFHCKLTSLISRALLQGALDKEASH